METIGERIRKLMMERDLTPYKVSKATGISQSTIGRILKGESEPNRSTLVLLEDFLDLNLHSQLSKVEESASIYGGSKVVNMTGYKARKPDLVPFYELDFAAGNQIEMIDSSSIKPEYYMDIPEFYGCTAFRAYSDSMAPMIRSGSILFGTKINEWRRHLEFGQIYGIICMDGRRYLKYIRRDRELPKERFLLRSENQQYDDFEIPLDDIRSIWLIHGWINKRI